MVTLLGVVLAAAVVGLSVAIDGRVMDFYLAHGRNEVARTVRWTIGTHVAAAACWIPVGVTAPAISNASGHRAWAGIVVVPMIVLYGPFVLCFLTSKIGGNRQSRSAFRARGASDEVSRALYSTSTPFAIFGLSGTIASFFACFVA